MTERGLVRFDGVRFTWFAQVPGAPSTVGFGLWVGNDGTLWLGLFDGGVVNVNIRDNSATYYPPGNGLLEGQARIILQDRRGFVWLGTSEGVSRLAKGKWRTFTAADGLPQNRTDAIFEDHAGTIWAGTARGIFRWDPAADRFIHVPGANEFVTQFGELSDKRLWVCTIKGGGPLENGTHRIIWDEGGSFLEDRHGNVWLGSTTIGIQFIRDWESLGKAAPRERLTSDEGLSNDDTWNFLEDREGNIWLGTDDGLDEFRPSNFAVLMDKKILNKPIQQIVAKKNDLWIMAQDRLFRASAGNNSVDFVASPPPFEFSANGNDPILVPSYANLAEPARGQVQSFALSKSNPLNGPGTYVRQSDGSYLLADSVSGVMEWRDGHLRALPEFIGNHVLIVTRDSKGQLWAAGNLGLWWWHDGRWAHYGHGEKAFSDVISFLYFADDGAMWMMGQNISRLKDGKVVSFGSNIGSSANCMIEDGEGFTWLCGRSGLYRIAKTEWEKATQQSSYAIQYRKFDESDGLPSLPQNYAGLWISQTQDGRLWLGLRNGVVSFDPRHINTNQMPPPIAIEDLTADGKVLPAVDGYRLPPLTKSLQIDYTALSFAVPEKVRFKIKLEGFDSDWVGPGSRRQAFYTNLSPGHYRFRVLAANNDGIWNDAGAYWDFSVLPAYYQTKWFQAACFAVFAILVWGFFRLRVYQMAEQFHARMDERVAERTRIARELHDTLLQTFQGLVLRFQAVSKQLPENAQTAREALSSALQKADLAIAEGRDAVQNLRCAAANLKGIEEALSQCGNELSNEYSVAFRLIEEGQPRDLHPVVQDEVYRIGREALLNAFRHANAKAIETELAYADRDFRLRIRDNGRGMNPEILRSGEPAGHFGLLTMRERASRIGGQLDIWSRPGAGSEVELKIAGSIAYAGSPIRKHRWPFRRPERICE